MSNTQLFNEANELLKWAAICIYETEVEFAPPFTDEQIETLPKAYRLRANRRFLQALDLYKNKCNETQPC